MSGVTVVYEHGPVTYTVAEAVTGGQLIEARASSVVGVAAAGSVKVLGVALKDATNATPAATDSYPLPSTVPVAKNAHVRVTYAANANFGDKLKAAANGQVTPFVGGTDTDPRLIVGYCAEPAGVTSGGTGLAYIR